MLEYLPNAQVTAGRLLLVTTHETTEYHYPAMGVRESILEGIACTKTDW